VDKTGDPPGSGHLIGRLLAHLAGELERRGAGVNPGCSGASSLHGDFSALSGALADFRTCYGWRYKLVQCRPFRRPSISSN